MLSERLILILSGQIFASRMNELTRTASLSADLSAETFTPTTVNRGQNRHVRTPGVEDQVLRHIEENPKLSTIQIALEMQNVSRETV